MTIKAHIKDFKAGKHRAIVSHSGVFEYNDRKVYRSPNEVFSKAALDSLVGTVVSLEHDMVDGSNWRDNICGTVLSYEIIDGNLVVQFVINDPEVEEMIQSGDLQEVSLGYAAEVFQESGVFEEQEYDHVVKNIIVNHLALGPKDWARVDAAKILDSKKETKSIELAIKGTIETNECSPHKEKEMERNIKKDSMKEDKPKDAELEKPVDEEEDKPTEADTDPVDFDEKPMDEKPEEDPKDEAKEEESDEEEGMTLEKLSERLSQLEAKFDNLIKEDSETDPVEDSETGYEEDSDEEKKDGEKEEAKDSKTDLEKDLDILLDCKTLKPTVKVKGRSVVEVMSEVLNKRGSLEYLKGVLDSRLENRFSKSQFDNKVDGEQTKVIDIDDVFYGRAGRK